MEHLRSANIRGERKTYNKSIYHKKANLRSAEIIILIKETKEIKDSINLLIVSFILLIYILISS